MNSQLTVATHILAVLAHHRNQGAVTSQVLADGFGTHPVVVRRVIARLKHAGLVASKTGQGGGSILARDPDDITLRDVYLAVTEEADTILTRPPGNCDQGADIAPIIGDYLNALLADAERTVLTKLQQIRLSDVTQEIATRLQSTSGQDFM